MKITQIKTFVMNAHRTNWVFVKLYTDAGVTGVGEGTLEGLERAVVSVAEEMGEYLIGEDPFAVEHHAEILTRDAYWRSSAVFRSALSAVEAAMLDIKGKALGVPVYELLGGKCRDSIQCYANGWFAGSKDSEQFAAAAKRTTEAGFDILKFDPLGSNYMTLSRAEHVKSLSLVRMVRDAVGDDAGLIIEGHGRLDVNSAIRFGRDLEAFSPLYYEEPVPPESLAALAAVRQAISVPIATGERYFERHRFAELMDQGAADLLQPDVCHVGGLSEMKAIAALARSRYLSIAPHNPLGPVGNAMSLQLAACISNFEFLETLYADVPWRHDVTDESVVMSAGKMVIPTRPGLGIDIDEEAIARFPYKRSSLGRQYQVSVARTAARGTIPWYSTAQ